MKHSECYENKGYSTFQKLICHRCTSGKHQLTKVIFTEALTDGGSFSSSSNTNITVIQTDIIVVTVLIKEIIMNMVSTYR